MADLESEPTSESTPGRSSGVYSDSEEEEDRRGDEADAYGYSFWLTIQIAPLFSAHLPNVDSGRAIPCRLDPCKRGNHCQSSLVFPHPPFLQQKPLFGRYLNPRLRSHLQKMISRRKNRIYRTVRQKKPRPTPPPFPSILRQRRGPIRHIRFHLCPVTVKVASVLMSMIYRHPPLPPSSPPTSPAFSVSRLSRSVSPIFLDRESYLTRSSSPLSELPDDDDTFDDLNELSGTLPEVGFLILSLLMYGY